MKINLLKIGMIKNIDELKKYKINKSIFLNNYLFHYLIITNNLEGLKLKNFKIYKENDENLNGFHLASKYNYIKILNYLIKEYPEYVNNKNSINEYFLHYLSPVNKDYLSIFKNK